LLAREMNIKIQQNFYTSHLDISGNGIIHSMNYQKTERSLPVVQIILEKHEPITQIASEENKVSGTMLAFKTSELYPQAKLTYQCNT